MKLEEFNTRKHNQNQLNKQYSLKQIFRDYSKSPLKILKGFLETSGFMAKLQRKKKKRINNIFVFIENKEIL